MGDGADHQKDGGKGGKRGTTEAIDRFAIIIDAESPRFANQRRENCTSNEQNVQSICTTFHNSQKAYFERKTEIHCGIVNSILEKRDQVWPQCDPAEVTEEVKELCLSPWVFQSLPGTKPATQWPNSLQALAERLDTLEPLALWNEPLDLINGGPEFFSQASAFIQSHSSKLAVAPTPELIDQTSLSLTCHLQMAVHTGNHERILESFEHLHSLSNLDADTQTKVFELIRPRAIKCLKDMQDLKEMRQKQRLHTIQSSSIHGLISMASYTSFVNLQEFQCSMTVSSSGAYLYIWISHP